MTARNSALCLRCNEEIESKSTHDFKYCKCKNVFVDGGLAYFRHGVKLPEYYVNTST